MGVNKDAADFGVGFAFRAEGVEGVFGCCRVLLSDILFGWGREWREFRERVGGRGVFSLLTNVVRPFELDGYIRVAGVICFNTFDNCEGGDVLEKDNGGLV